MRSTNTFFVVDTHTEGEPTRIILSGFPRLKGNTIIDKRGFLCSKLDYLRTSVLLEPRGHDNQFGALVLPTRKHGADYALIFMDNRGFLDMCGHGTMGVTTALIELGMVEPKEPHTYVTFETVAGLVKAEARVVNGGVEEVSFVNVPSFYVGTFELELEKGNTIPIDIAYGGNFYVIAEARDLGIRVRKGCIRELIGKGIVLRDKAAEQIEVHHPGAPEVPGKVDLAMITDEPELQGSDGKNIVVFGNGQFDRSPCGTGTSARVATLNSKGLLEVGENYIHESIIKTRFRAKILETTKIGDLDAVVPKIMGRAFITQISHTMIHPEDPLKNGFSILH